MLRCKMLKMMPTMHSLWNTTKSSENLLEVESQGKLLMDCVWNLLRFQQAIKENNLALYGYSVRQLCSVMFSSDHLNYAQYLPFYLPSTAESLSHSSWC